MTNTRRQIPLTELIEKYRIHLQAAGRTPRSVQKADRELRQLAADIHLTILTGITAEKIESWIVRQRETNKRSAGTINAYIGRLKSFCKWAVQTGHAVKSPVETIPKLNEDADRRKVRRAMTAEELTLLFEAARQKGERRTENVELIYRLLAGTGLRSAELSQITPSQFDFAQCRFQVNAAATKNRKTAVLPVHPVLSERLRQYVEECRILPADRIFKHVPSKLLRWFHSDLKSAGIARIAPDGRSLDVHSLRKTFGTMLARAGVPLTTTQRLMRHSKPELTAKLYIDVEPAEMLEAVKKLPVIE